MKTYDINIHFDAAITLHGIVADNEEEAKRLAYERASQMNLFCAAMDTTPTTAEVEHEDWLKRYKPLYSAIVDTTDKVWQKGAVSEGLKVLCDKMDEYVCNNDDPDYKGNEPQTMEQRGQNDACISYAESRQSSGEPQMIVRYQEDPDDEEDYWNLFLYCTGPNDSTDDKDFLAIRGAWQHVWYDENGKEDIDDYDMMEWNSRRECMQYLFYTPGGEENPRPDNMYMTQIWVED